MAAAKNQPKLAKYFSTKPTGNFAAAALGIKITGKSSILLHKIWPPHTVQPCGT
jgi:hypothetical protein